MSRLLIGTGVAALVLAVYVYRNTRLRHWREALRIMRKADAGQPLTNFEKLVTRPIVKRTYRHPVGSDERQIEDVAFELGKLFPKWTTADKPVPMPVLLDPYIVGFSITVATVTAVLLGTDEEVAWDRRFALWINVAAALARVEPAIMFTEFQAVRQTADSAEIERGRLDGLSYLDALTSGKPPAAQGRLIHVLKERHAADLDATFT
jgi:hypothetical protein